jgi:hypothetical protein
MAIWSRLRYLHRAVTPLPQSPSSRRVSPDIEAYQRVLISSPPIEHLVLVLWLNQVSRWFCGEPPQTLHVDFGRELLACTGSCPRLHLAFLATMRLELDPIRPPRPSGRAYLSFHSLETKKG